MKNRPDKKSGFTLIELLVVISIIGLLSSIVLAALSSARLKAQDARLISEMINLRTAAQLYQSSNGQYDNPSSSNLVRSYATCGPTTIGDIPSGASKLLLDIAVLSKATTDSEFFPPSNNNVQCGVTTTSYVVFARLPSSLSGTALYFCIDSSGKTKNNVTFVSSSSYGDGTTATPFTCP